MPISDYPVNAHRHAFWLTLYTILDLSWIWHDQIAYRISTFSYGPVLEGQGCAPEQYRIAGPLAARWIAAHLHFHSFMAGGLFIDLLGSLLLSVLLYLLLLTCLKGAPPAVQVCAKVFLGLWMLFYLHWSYGFARVETIPSCLYIVASLLLLRQVTWARGLRSLCCSAAFVLLSLLQGWIRADVAVVLAVGVCASPLFRSTAIPSAQRLAILSVGTLAALVSGGSLLYLMRIRYPNAHYCCGVLSLSYNFGHGYAYIPFLTLIPPILWGIVSLARRFPSLSAADRSILIGSGIYLVVWTCMGSWGEARIIAPFAMGLLPAICTSMANFLAAPDAPGL